MQNNIFKKLPLYIDVDGVLFMFKKASAERSDTFMNLRPFTTSFLWWCHQRFDCRWLTAWKSNALSLAGNIYANFACSWPVIPWGDNKTEGIDFSEDFIWIDDDEFAGEQHDLETFCNKNKFQRFLLVDKYNIDELDIVKAKLQSMLNESGYDQHLVLMEG
jgi:hypothetical protein